MLNKRYNDGVKRARSKKEEEVDSFTVLLQFVSRYKEKVEKRELLTLIVNALGGSEFISPCNHSDIYAGIKSISIDCEQSKSLTLE